jgi:hypothetical protein
MLWRLLLLSAGVAVAAEPALRPRWRTGDEFTLEIVRTREDSRRPQANGTSATLVALRVLETGLRGSVVEWTPGPTGFSNPEAAKNPLVARSMDALKGLRFELVLNEDGNYTGVRNEAEVTAKLGKVLGEMLPATGSSHPQLESAMRQALAPAALTASATKEAQMYFVFGGIELRRGFLAEAPIEPPSPLGGEPLKAVTRIAVTALDANSVTSTITTRYEPESLRSMTYAFLQQAGVKMPAAQWNDVPPIRMTDDTEATSDLALGLAIRLRVVRRIAIDGQMNRLDEWGMRLVKRPPR